MPVGCDHHDRRWLRVAAAEVFGNVRGNVGEVVRLCWVAGERPPWLQVAAFVVSVWTLWWIGGQFVVSGAPPSAIEVLGNLGGRFGLAESSWGERVARAWEHAGPVLATAGGLLWAATSEREQSTALLGWVCVMLGSEQIGYQPSVVVAVGALVGFVVVLLGCSIVVERTARGVPRMMSRDVVRAGVVAATLSAVVPLFAPCFFAFRLVRPYLTRPPRVVRSGGWSEVPEQAAPRRSEAGQLEV